MPERSVSILTLTVEQRLNKLFGIKRNKIISKSPERVISFPPFGGLFLMPICRNIKPSKSTANRKTIQPIWNKEKHHERYKH